MMEILREPRFRRLFSAQLVALVGTGLATVALALLAFDLAGEQAGAVLGTALAIKMVVYVVLSPVAGAVVPPGARKQALIGLDLVRAAVAMVLPFADQVWHIYVLIALLQSASACFTPMFQSLIPEVLPEERDYTRALSLSRLAYDLESLLSPALAAALLAIVSFHALFAGTSIGFLISALFVWYVSFPAAATTMRRSGSPYARAFRGMRIYLHTPRLRGLLALTLCAAAGGAMVFVNTVVIVRSVLQGSDREVAWALAAFGTGSMAAALVLPKLLDRLPDRRVMLVSALVMAGTLSVATALWHANQGRIGWATLLPLWAALGMAYAGLVTPGGRLLRRSAQADDLPFLFAAQFSLSHVCWLFAYPFAGWLGVHYGLGTTLLALACLSVAGLLAAWLAWPKADPDLVEHTRPEMPDDHTHQKESAHSEKTHAHALRIDDVHRRWPRR